MKFRWIVVLFACGLFSTFATEARAQSPSGSLPDGVVNVVYPTYPPLARAARATGVVSVRVSVDPAGKVVKSEIRDGHAFLHKTVLNAVKDWRFETVAPDSPERTVGLTIEFQLTPCQENPEDKHSFDPVSKYVLVLGCEVRVEQDLEKSRIQSQSRADFLETDFKQIPTIDDPPRFTLEKRTIVDLPVQGTGCGPNLGLPPQNQAAFSINGIRERKQKNQQGTGNVNGIIRDENGNPVADAVLRIVDGKQTLAVVQTTENGRFSFKNIPAGDYGLLIARPTVFKNGTVFSRHLKIRKGTTLIYNTTVSNPTEFDAMTDRALEQRKQADLIIDYDGDDRLFFSKPCAREGGYQKPFTRDEFERRLDSLSVEKSLAVVVIGKGVGMDSDEALGKLMDSLETFLKGKGFKRVVFHQAHSMGIPILRE